MSTQEDIRLTVWEEFRMDPFEAKERYSSEPRLKYIDVLETLSPKQKNEHLKLLTRIRIEHEY